MGVYVVQAPDATAGSGGGEQLQVSKFEHKRSVSRASLFTWHLCQVSVFAFKLLLGLRLREWSRLVDHTWMESLLYYTLDAIAN